MRYITGFSEGIIGYKPGGLGSPGTFPIGYKYKNTSDNSKYESKFQQFKDEIKNLKEENKRLKQDIENMIEYAPGSKKYNQAKEHFETLQKS